MAKKNSDVVVAQLNPTAKAQIDEIKLMGNLSYVRASYTIVSGDAAGDVIRLVEVPGGVELIPHLSKTNTDGLGTGVTVDIGDNDDTDAVDADRYADGLDVAASGGDFFDANAVSASLTPYVTQKKCYIQATLAVTSAGSLTVGKKIIFRMVFARR